MQIRPILSALSRNKTGAILIALQIALTMTILVNAIAMIQQRQGQMARPSGIDEGNIFTFSYMGFADDFNEKTQVQADLDYIRQLPGVIDAIQTNAAPLTSSGWSMSLKTGLDDDAQDVGTAVYFVDEHGIDSYGLNLIAGENFKPEAMMDWEMGNSKWPNQGIITKTLANDLFENDWQSALGQTVYINDNQPVNVIGIVETLQAPWNGWDGVERSLLSPVFTQFGSGLIVVRTEPGQRDRLMTDIEDGLISNYKGRLIRQMRSMDETRERSYQNHNGINTILTTLVICLTVVTALGIVGLASFSVNRRRKQIGTRRALGARKVDIMQYFMVENFMITTVGVVLGAGLAVGLNMLLVSNLNIQPIAWYYIPAGMLCLWVIGQLAVYGPAKKACRISPALATRSI